MPHKNYKHRRRNTKNENHEVLGITLVVVSVFFLLCIVIPPILSLVSRAVFSIVLGVFGIVAYPFFIAMLLIGICLLMHKQINMPTVKTCVCSVLIGIFALTIFQLASTHAFLKYDFSDYISKVYAAKYSFGGVVWGTVAYALKTILTEVGCYIIFSIAILITVAVMVNLVSRIKASKRPQAVVLMDKPSAPTFDTRQEPQKVMPVEPTQGLFNYRIAKRPQPKVTTETGKASEIPQTEKRLVKDYADNEIVNNPLKKENVDARRAALMALYGDKNDIKKRMAEEYIREREEERRNEEVVREMHNEQVQSAKSTMQNVNDVGVQDDTQNYNQINNSEDSTQQKSGIRPKKVVHEMPTVFFPVEKHLEYNDATEIEDIDAINKKKLEEDALRYKMDQMSAGNEYSSGGGSILSTADANDGGWKKTGFNESRYGYKNQPVVQQADIVNLDAQKDSSSKEKISKSSNDDRLINEDREIANREVKFLKLFNAENNPKQEDIVNADVLRSTQNRGRDIERTQPENEENTLDDIIVAKRDEDVKKERDLNSVREQENKKVDDADDDGIIDLSQESNDTENGEAAEEKVKSIIISDEPAVDMSETHDINSDLIDGEDLSGMYVSADEPSFKSSKRTRGVVPLDKQISIQSVIDERVDESITLTPTRRHKRYENYIAPPIDLLKRHQSDEISEEELKNNAERLEIVIGQFLKTEVKVVNIVPGPTVTRYEVECPLGVSVKQIETHSADIEYELAAVSSVRIEAPIPGKRAVGIEVPNASKSIVGIRDIVESDEYQKAKSPMTFAVGKGISGDVVLCDLEKIPHLLIAGQTGSGKSACLNGLIISLLYKSSPEDLRFILVDPKRVEFSAYSGMPHLLFNNIIYEPNEVLSALKWAANEMERRYALLSKYRCNQVSVFNKLPEVKSGKMDRMPHIIMIIDELADIMSSNVKKDIEDKIKVIAAKARAAGIHLIVATQRPSADVITGTIKTNLTSRIAFKVSGQTDSRIILDCQGAEALVGKGDMLFFPVDFSSPKRVQGSFISDEEVASVLGYIKENVECDFDEDAANAVFGGGDDAVGSSEIGLEKAKSDPLLPDVLSLIIKTKQASTSSIQRRFAIGFARASRIMDIMEASGFIGPTTGNSKPREVYITAEKYRELFGRDVDDN